MSATLNDVNVALDRAIDLLASYNDDQENAFKASSILIDAAADLEKIMNTVVGIIE